MAHHHHHDKYSSAVRSTASIAGHPIHPALIPFPIAFFIGALASDLAYYVTTDLFWARASLWLVGAGVVSAAAAAVFGLIDFSTISRARAHRDGWIHVLGNSTIVLLQIVSWYLRASMGPEAIIPWGLAISAIGAAMLGVTGWYGGELAYRHMIGVSGAVCEPRPGEKEKHHKHRHEEEAFRKAA
jgi:uncharacterized membrane protein